jgi:hypothetical protein
MCKLFLPGAVGAGGPCRVAEVLSTAPAARQTINSGGIFYRRGGGVVRPKRIEYRQSTKLFPSSELGLPHLLTRRRVCPPPFGTVGGGGGHTGLWERGWESPNSDERTYIVVLCIYMYVVAKRIEKYRKIRHLVFLDRNSNFAISQFP